MTAEIETNSDHLYQVREVAEAVNLLEEITQKSIKEISLFETTDGVFVRQVTWN